MNECSFKIRPECREGNEWKWDEQEVKYHEIYDRTDQFKCARIHHRIRGEKDGEYHVDKREIKKSKNNDPKETQRRKSNEETSETVFISSHLIRDIPACAIENDPKYK